MFFPGGKLISLPTKKIYGDDQNRILIKSFIYPVLLIILSRMLLSLTLHVRLVGWRGKKINCQ